MDNSSSVAHLFESGSMFEKLFKLEDIVNFFAIVFLYYKNQGGFEGFMLLSD